MPFILRFLGVQKSQCFVKSRLFFAWRVIAHPEVCSPFFSSAVFSWLHSLPPQPPGGISVSAVVLRWSGELVWPPEGGARHGHLGSTPAVSLNQTQSPHVAVIHSRTETEGASVLLAGAEGLGELTLLWGGSGAW